MDRSDYNGSMNSMNNGGNCFYANSGNIAGFPCRIGGQASPYQNFGLCDYTECNTASGDPCVFPFTYKGRLYDTCVTQDSMGTNPGDSWCSTATDEFKNHVLGNEASCSTSCRVADCPVGFWKMYHSDTCYHVSFNCVLY